MTFQLTSKLLSHNPEYYTIWNYRRLILQHLFTQGVHSSNDGKASAELHNAGVATAHNVELTEKQNAIATLIKDDLHFLIPLLRQFPKCYWIWDHRSWLLATATEHLPVAAAIGLWQGELGLVTKMLGLDSRNFHGWGYRRSVVAALEKQTGQSMVQSEFEYTTKMINANLSNFSAWHNRSQLIPRLLDERKANSQERKKLLDEEIELITTALYTDPYDQSLWFYHQYLMSTLDPDAPTNSPEYSRNTRILETVGESDRLHYLEQELDSIREMLDGAEDCKYIYQALLEYAQRDLELDAGNKKVTKQEMESWLGALKKIDPLRRGRWADLEAKMKF